MATDRFGEFHAAHARRSVGQGPTAEDDQPERGLFRRVGGAGLAVTLALLGAGCSHSPAPVKLSPSEAAALAQAGAPSATPSGSATSPATPFVAKVSGSACKTPAFLAHAGLAGGAIDGYLSKPYRAGQLTGGATVRTAATAASFAAAHLRSAAAAVRGCKSATALTSVAMQSSAALGQTARDLASGRVTQQRIDAAGAFFFDVVVQAERLQLTIVPKTPSTAQLT
jgi:hypothetical protein